MLLAWLMGTFMESRHAPVTAQVSPSRAARGAQLSELSEAREPCVHRHVLATVASARRAQSRPPSSRRAVLAPLRALLPIRRL